MSQSRKRFVHFNLFLYKLTNGKLGGRLRESTVLLLTTTGRKTGQPRTTPLRYLRHENVLMVAASNWGEEEHPAWYKNLQDNPIATIQNMDQHFTVRAEDSALRTLRFALPAVHQRRPSFRRLSPHHQARRSHRLSPSAISQDVGTRHCLVCSKNHFIPFSNRLSLKIETNVPTNVSPFDSKLWHTDVTHQLPLVCLMSFRRQF